jgi:hypothetical protein
MENGAIPVIGYLLSQPLRISGRLKDMKNPMYSHKHNRILTSEEFELSQCCTGVPKLCTKKMTDMLVKERYKLRLSGQQSIEDSMLKCKL